MKKNIRSKAVSDTLKDYETLTESLKENTEGAVKSLLSETVRNTYAKLLAEADDEDYDEEEVEDTDADMVDDAEVGDVDVDVTDDPESEVADDVEDDVLDGEGGDDADVTVDVSVEDGDGQDDEWAEFDKYKMSDDEYDLSDAEDDEIVKVYKLMKDDDQIIVHNDECGNTSLKDNETGAEYIISMGGCDDETNACDVADAGLNDLDDMNESNERLYELVLEDNAVGYTNDYQDKDVMTNDGMEETANKGYRQWDKGLPGNRTSKPWSGYPKKKADKPFTEEFDADSYEDLGESFTDDMDEATNVGGYVQQNSDSKSHAPSGRKTPRSGSHSGRRVKGTVTPRYNKADESLMRRIDNALNENRDLKYTLKGVMKSLKEAAVTNHNLAQIVKLISENSTTNEEKKEIISRFAKEANTIQESKKLYESINRSLKNPKRIAITEEKTPEQERVSINETTIYKSQDMLDSLDLMHRTMNL